MAASFDSRICTMPHLCFCAASATLHETLLCQMELYAGQSNHDSGHQHRHHSQYQNQRNITKVLADERNDGVSQFRATSNGVLGSYATGQWDRRTSVEKLRPDLAVIPRIGFPPDKPNENTRGSKSKRSSSTTTFNAFPSNLLTFNRDALECLLDKSPSPDSNSSDFCRIEAIYI